MGIYNDDQERTSPSHEHDTDQTEEKGNRNPSNNSSLPLKKKKSGVGVLGRMFSINNKSDQKSRNPSPPRSNERIQPGKIQSGKNEIQKYHHQQQQQQQEQEQRED